MKNIRPCPYCGSEVEMVKLIQKPKEKKQPYRIQCTRCKQLVARGDKFPIETISEAEERIADYNREIERLWSPNSSTNIRQTDSAKARDWIAANPSMYGEDDEFNEVHDVAEP